MEKLYIAKDSIKTVTTSLIIDEELHAEFRTRAFREKKTMNQILNELISQYLEAQKKQEEKKEATIKFLREEGKERLYTVHEAAKILGVCSQTIKRRVKDGKIQAYKVGGAENSPWRISEKELENYLQQNIMQGDGIVD